MKLQNKKTIAFVFTLIMVSSIGIELLVPTVSAHTPAWNTPTYAFLSVTPNPIGVGQNVLLNFWLDKLPPTANTAFGDRWEGLTVQVTDPNGKTSTVGTFTTDDVGAAYTTYTPDTIGNYTFQMFFPGQTITGKNPNPVTGTSNTAFLGDYYKPSNSSEVTVVVQQEPISPWPVTPLPKEYWTRPINGMNPEWSFVVGDWLMSNYDGYSFYNPYTTAPESGHIMWTYPLAPGGVVGGNYTDWNYYTGLAYETKMSSPIVIDGKLILNLPLSTASSSGGAVAIDIHTGKQLWYQNNTRISFAQYYDYNSPNQFGVIPYLWSTGSTYNCYDPMTGQWLFSLSNALTGTNVFGPNGEILVYVLNGQANTLLKWNSTKAIMYYQQPGVMPGGNVWQWRPMMNKTMDWRKGIEWNVTTKIYNQPQTQSIKKISPDAILATTINAWALPLTSEMEIAYSTKDGKEMWAVNRTLPDGIAISWNTLQGSPVGDGIYTQFYPETMTWAGYSLNNGAKVWGPTDPYPNAYGVYSWQARIGEGKLFGIDYGGYVHAYNLQTGEKLWDFFTGPSGLDVNYDGYPLNQPAAAADGKFYVTAGHAYNPPLFKGAKVYCLNATDGSLIWDALGFYNYNGIAIAEGSLILYNNYDGQVYCYGKGPTALTVTAPDAGVRPDQSVVIRGTVTDISAGTRQTEPATRFPHGVPAVGDENQSRWMEYVYMQQPKPDNTIGVKVSINVFDQNGNYRNIGETTTDSDGFFTFNWKPDIAGAYTVYASFAGSKSYYPSHAETSFVVDEPLVSPTAQPQIIAQTPFELYFAATAVAIILAIAILGVLLLRKRP